MMCLSRHPSRIDENGERLRCMFIFDDHSGPHMWTPPPQESWVEWDRVPGEIPERVEVDDDDEVSPNDGSRP